MSLEATTQYDEPLVWTPDQIHQLAVSLHNNILLLNDDIARAIRSVPANELAAWRSYRDEWAKWYGSFNWSSGLWGGTVSLIQGYATRLNAWAKKYVAWTGKEPSGTGTYDIKNSLADALSSPLLWAGLGAIGAVGAYLYLDRRQRS